MNQECVVDVAARRADVDHDLRRIAAVYAARSGRPAGEFEALMAENNGNGRWLSPEEAVAAGLADTVTDNEERTAPSLAGNIARGWERLLAGIGLNRREELPADRNVLLTAGERRGVLLRLPYGRGRAAQQLLPFSRGEQYIAVGG